MVPTGKKQKDDAHRLQSSKGGYNDSAHFGDGERPRLLEKKLRNAMHYGAFRLANEILPHKVWA